MHITITLDYDRNLIQVERNGYEAKPHKIRDAVDENGKPVRVKWGQTWGLVILNYILHHFIPFSEFNISDDVVTYLTKKAKKTKYSGKDFSELASRVRDYLNNNPLKMYPFLQIEEDYSLPKAVNEHQIDWVIICSKDKGFERLDEYFADITWEGSYRPEEEHADSNDGNGSQSDNTESTVYTVDSTDRSIQWTPLALGTDTLAADAKQLSTIDEALLPAVRRNEREFVNLSEYVTEYIKEDQTQENRSFAIIEGRMGSGKTYSLKKAVADLRNEPGHIAVMVSAREMLSTGRRSLFDCLGKYIEGYKDLDNEQRVRKILKKEKAKVVIVIDGLDEALASGYPSLAIDINKIGAIGNPNVYIILSTRNALSFIKSSGVIGDHVHFRRCENLYICDLKDTVLTAKETRLRQILAERPETRTPLFISYYREIQALADERKSDNDRRRNLDKYAGNINYSGIDNYYDLFVARTMLLGAHAESRSMSKEWYYSVIPALSYYMYKSNLSTFTIDTIKELFEDTDNDNSDYEFKWITRVVRSNYTSSLEDFETMYPEEKLLQLMNTGLITAVGGMETADITDDEFVINEHFEYTNFLTAMFISRVAREIDNDCARKSVLNMLKDRTSYHLNNTDLLRIEKMKFIPIAYYTVLDIMKHGPASRPDLMSTAAQHNLDEFIENFDPIIYMIAANAVYEGRELWYQTEGLSESLMNYCRGRVTAPKSRLAVEGFDDWQLIEAVSGISYMHIRKRDDDPEKWNILQRINLDLNNCAAIIMHDVLNSMKKSRIYTENSQANKGVWDENLSISNMQALTSLLDKGIQYSSRSGFPVDLIGKVYSNIGAVKQEMSKYVHKSNVKEAIDYLEEAKKFHDLTLQFRNTVLKTIPEEVNNISLIRSLITLATDYYYKADYSETYEAAESSIDEAVKYHFSALKRQGLDPAEFVNYKLDGQIHIERTLDVVEIPRVNGEPFVICPRIAGAYYLLYKKTCAELDKAQEQNSEESVIIFSNKLQNLVEKQLIYLKAAYLFLREECYVYGEDKKTLEASGPKLEMNAHEIDLLYKDAEKSYLNSFRMLSDKNAGKELLLSIQKLYKDLHPHSNKHLLSENEWAKWMQN